MIITLTKIIIDSKLTASRVYVLLARLKEKPNEKGIYCAGVIERLLKEHAKSKNEDYYCR